MFVSKPKTNITSPHEKNDHPEFDVSELLDFEVIQQYQSLTGLLKWDTSLGRLDIATSITRLSASNPYHVVETSTKLNELHSTNMASNLRRFFLNS